MDRAKALKGRQFALLRRSPNEQRQKAQDRQPQADRGFRQAQFHDPLIAINAKQQKTERDPNVAKLDRRLESPGLDGLAFVVSCRPESPSEFLLPLADGTARSSDERVTDAADTKSRPQ